MNPTLVALLTLGISVLIRKNKDNWDAKIAKAAADATEALSAKKTQEVADEQKFLESRITYIEEHFPLLHALSHPGGELYLRPNLFRGFANTRIFTQNNDVLHKKFPNWQLDILVLTKCVKMEKELKLWANSADICTYNSAFNY